MKGRVVAVKGWGSFTILFLGRLIQRREEELTGHLKWIVWSLLK